jgi:hypothetical protein
LGVFSGFVWPLPNGKAGAWVEAEVDPCRSGVHACRQVHLPYWLAPELFEIELDGDAVEEGLKVVAPRGRLVRRIEAWNERTRDEYSQMCIARAGEVAASAPERVADWAPRVEDAAAGPALMGFMAARIAEQLGGVEAYVEERRRQSDWLTDRLALDHQ